MKVQFGLRFIFCFIIAWLITNGWAYLGAALGALFRIRLLTAVSSAYLAFLWFPGTPEKMVTLAIACALYRKLPFPRLRT